MTKQIGSMMTFMFGFFTLRARWSDALLGHQQPVARCSSSGPDHGIGSACPKMDRRRLVWRQKPPRPPMVTAARPRRQHAEVDQLGWQAATRLATKRRQVEKEEVERMTNGGQEFTGKTVDEAIDCATHTWGQPGCTANRDCRAKEPGILGSSRQ
ncbi:MAG: hypothetical protein R2838_24305 [Caldilineaceae bacterium]